ncbi:MAG: hypothetical protein AAB289_16520, partial [Chloroflexota bacterium]
MIGTRPDGGRADASADVPGASPLVLAAPRKSTRKMTLPWTGGNFLVPNIYNHGTRVMGQLVAGAGDWSRAQGQNALVATLDGRNLVGMIDLTYGEDAARRVIDALRPRALKTLVAVSRLLYERTHGQPLNTSATLNVREIALATGHNPDGWRKISPEVLTAISSDLRALSQIMTYAADGEFDPKHRRHPSGWIAPLLQITAVHVAHPLADGDTSVYEFDAMLGRNWVQAMKERFGVVQIPPGFMQLNDQETLLAWWY